MKSQSLFTALVGITLGLLGGVDGHAMVSTPPARVIGSANLAACGAAVNKVLKSDPYGPIENSVAKIDSAYNAAACHLYFCKGYQLQDNANRVQTYSPGQSVHFLIDFVARHDGYANVSVVDLTTQRTIGAPLVNWPVYFNTSLGPPNWPKNETDFNVVIPTNLGTKCTTAGKCAIQWYWYAYNKQTYESCVDFVTA